jgi:glycosyltransferase involved in cell wall biosynthesis
MKRKEPLITVGMPVCNAMPWLTEAMESLLAQTSREFEILAIVDGGSDESLNFLLSIRDPRLRVIEQENAGVTATLNRLLQETQTPWMARQDADDVSYPGRIARLLRAIEETPGAGLIYSMADYHPRDRCKGRFRCSQGAPQQLTKMVRSGYLLSICHSTATLNVETARQLGGYRMDIHAEDADLWWRMGLHHEVHFIPESLVGFRQNSGSVSARNFETQQIAGLYVQYLLLSELWGRRPQPFAEVARVLRRFLRPAALRSKQSLRACNLHLAAGQPLRGAAAFVRAFIQSPRYVGRRMWDEFSHAAITNGVSPQLFLRKEEALWP